MKADNLQSILFSLNSCKSRGLDGVRLSDLRRNFSCVRNAFLLLNTIIESGRIPNELKIASVKPILKGGCRSKVKQELSAYFQFAMYSENFRAINIYHHVYVYRQAQLIVCKSVWLHCRAGHTTSPGRSFVRHKLCLWTQLMYWCVLYSRMKISRYS